MSSAEDAAPDDGLQFDLGNLAAFDTRSFDEKQYKCAALLRPSAAAAARRCRPLRRFHLAVNASRSRRSHRRCRCATAQETDEEGRWRGLPHRARH